MAPSTSQRLSDSTTGSTSTVRNKSTTATEFSVVSSPEAKELEAKQFTNLQLSDDLQQLYDDIQSTNENCLTYSGISIHSLTVNLLK